MQGLGRLMCPPCREIPARSRSQMRTSVRQELSRSGARCNVTRTNRVTASRLVSAAGNSVPDFRIAAGIGHQHVPERRARPQPALFGTVGRREARDYRIPSAARNYVRERTGYGWREKELPQQMRLLSISATCRGGNLHNVARRMTAVRFSTSPAEAQHHVVFLLPSKLRARSRIRTRCPGFHSRSRARRATG